MSGQGQGIEQVSSGKSHPSNVPQRDPVPGAKGNTAVSLETAEQDSIVHLYRTKVWLLGQIKETKAAILAAKNKDPPSSEDPEKLSESISKLQSDLLEISSENSLKELIYSRLQLGQALQNHLFPRPVPHGSEDASQTESQRKLGPLVEKQVELASEVLRLLKAMEEMRPELEAKRKKNFELIQQNRELMARIQQAKEDIMNRKKQSASEAVQMAQDKLEKVLSNITLVQNCFQGVIVGSGVNWAKEPELLDLMTSLGEPPLLD